jgi:two-component system, chemotaxis family, chemotaxis protein CheY
LINKKLKNLNMKTLVIVDDFKTNTVVMKAALHQMGFDILEANDGNEALKYFDGREIDLLVTDFRMPGMTGAELTRQVKSKTKYTALPVLILSSEKAEEMKQEARDAGAYGWLSKPFNMDRFLKIVNSIFK